MFNLKWLSTWSQWLNQKRIRAVFPRADWKILLLTGMLVLGACGGGSSGGDSGGSSSSAASSTSSSSSSTAQGTVVNMQTGAYTTSTLSTSTIGQSGGTISITSATDPLVGTKIEFPANALSGNVTVSITSAPITTTSGLPSGAAPRSRAIRLTAIDASAKPVQNLSQLVKITFPYETTSDEVNYYKIEKGGVLEPVGFDSINTTTRTITFRTRAPTATEVDYSPNLLFNPNLHASIAATTSYATYVAIGITQQRFTELINTAQSVDTGFLPSSNGWYIPNYGSYFRDSRGGNCFGMVGFAKFYYRQGYSAKLYDSYRDAQKTTPWVDDAVAIELASRVHNGMADIWNSYTSEEMSLQTSSTSVARSIIGALYVSKAPSLIYIQQVVGNSGTGAHAISIYRADLRANGSVTFHVYDPNKTKDDTVRIEWAPATGFANYLSGTTAADSSFAYNYFRHVGYYVGMDSSELLTLKANADSGFPTSTFPKITITKITGKTLSDNVMLNTGTTPAPASLPEYKTADTAVVIEGTVLGGNAQVAGQVVNNLQVITPSGTFSTPINNLAGAGDGKFTVTVPLKSGINQIALLAADPNNVSLWAAFNQAFIESTAAPSSFTATLSWNQGTSDIDLYVREPNGVAGTPTASKTGDVVYYAHREGISTTNPYLDFDNTVGYGPEHYIGRTGMVTKYSDGSSATTINGTYKIGVHYYAWHGNSDAATNKSVGWSVNWRYLKACKSPCTYPETDGLWVTGTRSGSLSTPDSSADGASGFAAGGASWSSLWDIDYPTPEMTWTVPPSTTVMLP